MGLHSRRARGQRLTAIGTKMVVIYGTEITSSREIVVCSNCIFTKNCVLDLVIHLFYFYVESDDWLYVCSAEKWVDEPCSQEVRLLLEQIR